MAARRVNYCQSGKGSRRNRPKPLAGKELGDTISSNDKGATARFRDEEPDRPYGKAHDDALAKFARTRSQTEVIAEPPVEPTPLEAKPTSRLPRFRR